VISDLKSAFFKVTLIAMNFVVGMPFALKGRLLYEEDRP
jgi:hypothetical protein